MNVVVVNEGELLELSFQTKRRYENPFADIDLTAKFQSPSGNIFSIPGFYDGDNIWKIRFAPMEPGEWQYTVETSIPDNDLAQFGRFTVLEKEKTGFLRTCPGKYWGFEYNRGEPCFLLGDTVYNLFGAAYCNIDVYPFLKRRAEQGFNLIRVRLPVSPFHPPLGYNVWQTRSCWPWSGSPQKPCFDIFNLDYFRTVDSVVRMVDKLGMGLEMIMQAWGFEYPFNARNVFVAEWEEMWVRYLIARYDAFCSVYIWNLMNEYEYYPNGDWHYDPTADRWAIRMARWVKSIACHHHPIAVHNGPEMPPFAERFKRDPKAVDIILFQYWGTRDKDDAWLAAGIEDQIKKSLEGWSGSAIFAEYGYERNPELPLFVPIHEYLDIDHTRRGAWRGAFCGLCIIHGFENTWGPYMIMDKDQPGVSQLVYLKRFFTEIVPFQYLRPSPDLIIEKKEEYQLGHRPLALSSEDKKWIAVYLPVGGEVSLNIKDIQKYWVRWFNPRTGKLTPAESRMVKGASVFSSEISGEGRPSDWVLLLESRS